jgi:hypothetical protein
VRLLGGRHLRLQVDGEAERTHDLHAGGGEHGRIGAVVVVGLIVAGLSPDADAALEPEALEGVGPPLGGRHQEAVVDVAPGQPARLQHDGHVGVGAGHGAEVKLGARRHAAIGARIRPDASPAHGEADHEAFA